MNKAIPIGRKMLLALLHACLLGMLAAPSTTHGAASALDDQYVFYGYAPPTVKPVFYRQAYGPMHRYVGSSPELTIVGIHNGTSGEVYNLADKGAIASFTIDRMELKRVSLANETYFKVVSDKLVSVLLSGGGWKTDGGHGVSTFYPSTEGGYAGHEFVFAPVNSTNGLHIFFIDDARVTIQDAKGSVIAELEATAGETKVAYLKRLPSEVDLLSLEAYRAESTGRIMLAGLGPNSFLYLPSLTGGFVGKHFLTVLDYCVVMVVALEDAEAAFYDLRRPSWHVTLLGPDVKIGLGSGDWYNTSDVRAPTRIESTGNISVLIGDCKGWWGSWWGPYVSGLAYPERIGDDVSFVVVRPDQEFGFFVPSEAVIFAHEESIVEVDGAMVTVKEDEYLRLAQGVHTVKASAPVTIEILGHGREYEFPEREARAFPERALLLEQYDNYASYLISYRGVREDLPDPPSVGGLREIVPYIALGAAIPIILVVAVFIRKRRERRTRLNH